MNTVETYQTQAPAWGVCVTPARAERPGREGPPLAGGRPAPGFDPAPGGDAEGEPLDLIEEHLTFTPPLPAVFDYHTPERSGRLLAGWAFPDGWSGSDGELTPVLKVQPFASGGYEATIRLLDLEKIGSAMDGNRRFGKREAPESQDFDHVQKASARAKRKVRHLVKNMGATNLVTLTRRETPDSGYWSPDDWAKAWDKARRNLEKIIGDFPYVGVLEQHKKGNYHLHLAWVGKVNLGLFRRVWWACCGGRGAGNVDSQYIKVRAGLERADRVAKYISKYTTKHFEDSGRFNKKRYWASRQTMQEARRYVLNAKTVEGGLNEAFQLLGLEVSDFMINHPTKGAILDHVFFFPDGGGAWINYIPDIHDKRVIPF